MNKSELKTNLPDNTAGSIEPVNIRDIVDTMLSNEDSNDMGGNIITGLPNPGNASDAATKEYVDNFPTTIIWGQITGTLTNQTDLASALNTKLATADYHAQVNTDWTSNSGLSELLHKPTLASVATSGDYNDLSNKPTSFGLNNVVSGSRSFAIGQNNIVLGDDSLAVGSNNTIISDDSVAIGAYAIARNNYELAHGGGERDDLQGSVQNSKIVFKCDGVGFVDILIPAYENSFEFIATLNVVGRTVTHTPAWGVWASGELLVGDQGEEYNLCKIDHQAVAAEGTGYFQVPSMIWMTPNTIRIVLLNSSTGETIYYTGTLDLTITAFVNSYFSASKPKAIKLEDYFTANKTMAEIWEEVKRQEK